MPLSNIATPGKAHPFSFQNKKRTVRDPGRSKMAMLLYEDFTAFSSPADRNGAGDRTRACAQRMPVVTGFDDPVAVLLSDNLADMVRPDHDGTDANRSGMAPMRPVAREVVFRSGIAADKLPHFPAAPCSRATAEAAAVGAWLRASPRRRLDAQAPAVHRPRLSICPGGLAPAESTTAGLL